MFKPIKYFLIFLSIDTLILSLLYNFYLQYPEGTERAIQNINISRIESRLYCEKHSEWQKADEFFYFKKDGAFYLHRSQSLRVFGVAKVGEFVGFDISIIGMVNGKLVIDTDFKNVNQQYYKFCYGPYCRRVYTAIILEYRFKLYDILRTRIASSILRENLLLKIQIKAYHWKRKIPIITKFIPVKIKHLVRNRKPKQDKMICSRVYEFDRNEDINQFESWLLFNKQLGYSKIVVYDNSIRKNLNFSILFDKYENFLEVRSIECFPNFFQDGEYMPHARRASELDSRAPGNFIINVFELVLYNECYYDHYDQFKIISILNSNEVLIQNEMNFLYDTNNQISVTNSSTASYQTQIYKVDALQCSTNNDSDHVYSISKAIKKDLGFKNGKSIFFMRSSLLSLDLMDLFFKHANRYILERKDKSFEEFDDSLRINDGNGNSFTVHISNHRQFQYAQFLNAFYRETLKPFLKKNQNLIKQVPHYFNRLFYVNKNLPAYGKTFYFTNETHKVIHHGPPTLYEKQTRSFVMAPFDKAHVANFNGFIRDKRKISIDRFQFDFGYFYCHYSLLKDNTFYSFKDNYDYN